jgi:hypothetical protein
MAIDVFEYLKPSSMALMKSFDTHGTIIILADSHFVVVQGNEWLLFFHNSKILFKELFFCTLLAH